MKRATITLAAGVMALFSAPAVAGLDVTVTPRHAAEGASDSEARLWTPRPGSVVSGPWNITIDATASTSLKEFSVSLLPEEQQLPTPAGGSIARTYGVNAKTADTIQIPWNSNALTPYNGFYKILSSATSHGANSEAKELLGLKVNNPPVTPVGVRAVIEEDGSSITWKPNPEPDITNYRVYRSVDDSSFSQIGVATGTRYTDADVPKDVSLRYQVVAIRRSVVTPGGVPSPPTKPTSSIVKIVPGTGSQPTEIEAGVPERLEEIAPTITQGARRDLGFAPGLPFNQPIPARYVAAAQQAEEPLISAPARAIQGAVYKPPFIAVALLLLVISFHLLRLGRLLASGTGGLIARQPPAASGGSQLLVRLGQTGRRSPLVWVRSRTTNLIGFPWKSNSSRKRLSKKRSQGTAGRPVANKTKVGGATEA